MPKVQTKSLIAGAIAWILLMIYVVNKSTCLDTDSCGAEDLFLTGILAIGMLAPSWFVAGLTTVLFDKENNKHREE